MVDCNSRTGPRPAGITMVDPSSSVGSLQVVTTIMGDPNNSSVGPRLAETTSTANEVDSPMANPVARGPAVGTAVGMATAGTMDTEVRPKTQGKTAAPARAQGRGTVRTIHTERSKLKMKAAMMKVITTMMSKTTRTRMELPTKGMAQPSLDALIRGETSIRLCRGA